MVRDSQCDVTNSAPSLLAVRRCAAYVDDCKSRVLLLLVDAGVLVLYMSIIGCQGRLLEYGWLLSLLRYHQSVMTHCMGGAPKADDSNADRSALERMFCRKHYHENDLIVNAARLTSLVNQFIASILSSGAGNPAT